jgi:peptidoglycan/xylan/chitin deacetylase (PgdA/CDA1 family)
LQLIRTGLRDVLTVVMFHRVIDPEDSQFASANPVYTVPTALFDELLEFFCRYYAVVGLADVIAAADRTRPLPEHALLISFDDGWADNLRYAVPLLRRRGLPAVIFAVAEPIVSPADTWWQEQIFYARRQGGLAALNPICPDEVADARRDAAPRDIDPRDIDPLDLVCRLGCLDEAERTRILAAIPMPGPISRMMLAPAELRSLAGLGIAVGLHGYSHLPLTRVSDIHAELRQAQSTIVSLSGDEQSAAALACPHGRYNAGVLTAAREVGIRLIFTSDPMLNRTNKGAIAAGRPLGRIDVGGHYLADREGRLDPSVAANLLWRQSLAAPPL